MFQTLTLPSPTSPLHSHSPSFPTSRRRSRHLSAANSWRPSAVRCRAPVFKDRHVTATPPAPSSLYEVLMVERSASMNEIKAAYRNLAKLHHPDAAQGSDGRNFVEINHAYRTLSDPASRAAYDSSIGLGRRMSRLTSASFGRDSAIGRRRSPFRTPTGTWETDQCW